MSYKNLNQLCEDIERKIDITDVVKYLGVKKGSSGDSYFCPLHENTNTPAFIAKKGYMTWHCASHCGTGNLYQLVQKVKNVSYIEAVKEVSENIAHITADIESLDKVKIIQKELIPLKPEHKDYIINVRNWDEKLIKDLEIQSWKSFIVFPVKLNNEIISYKFLNPKTKDFYFRGLDNSCKFYPNNIFNPEVENLSFVAGEWDLGLFEKGLRNFVNKNKYAVVSCSTGEKSYPLDIISQLKKLKHLKEIHIFYDNDQSGKDGALRLADKLFALGTGIKIYIHSFDDSFAKGYDVSDHIRNGYTVKDLFELPYFQYNPEIKQIDLSREEYNIEREILQFILFENKCIDDLHNENVRISDFKDWRFQQIYRTILNFYEGYKYCSLDLLKERIKDTVLQEAINEIVGARTILTIEEFFDSIKKIQAQAYKRFFEQSLNKLQMLKQKNLSVFDMQKNINTLFEELMIEGSHNDKTKSMDEILDDTTSELEDKTVDDFYTCFSNNINNCLGGGFRTGKVHLVSGEVSLGKSIFARMQAEHSSKQKVPTICYLTESEYREVGENTLSARSSINNYHFRSKNFNQDVNPRDIREKTRLETDKHLFYREACDFTVDELLNDIRLQVRKRGVKMVILDQLTSILTEGNMVRKDFITKVMNKLVRLALKEKICIIVITQLKREKQREKQGKKTNLFDKGAESADLADLAESADLERLAFTVIILTGNGSIEKEIIKVQLPKNRNYIKGVSTELIPEKHFSRFKDKVGANF